MRINTTNTQAITDAIREAEGKAHARTLDPESIGRAVERAEEKLQALGIPKKYWAGCTIQFVPEQVANSYNAFPAGTHATVTRHASGWFLTNVHRGRCGSRRFGGSRQERLHLSDLALANAPNSHQL